MPTVSTPGASLQYSRTGSGPPVLLIQGVGLVGEGWRPQVDGLKDRFTLVTFDNRGIGGSTIRDGRMTIDDMAADAIAIMDAEGIDRFHLTGHSMGGVIAQAVALRVPARVQSLAFLCTFARGQDAARITFSMLVTALRTRIGSKAMRRNAFMELIMPARYLAQTDRAALAARLEPLFGHDLAEQPSIAMKQLRALSRYDASSRLSSLAKIPTLVVSASEDRIARCACGKALSAAVPGARYVELLDAGHGVTIHRADDVNALLAGHFVRNERG